MGVSRKLLFLILISLVITSFAGGTAGWFIAKLTEEGKRLAAKQGEVTEGLFQIIYATVGVQSITQQLLRETDIDALQKLLDQGDQAAQSVQQRIGKLGGL